MSNGVVCREVYVPAAEYNALRKAIDESTSILEGWTGVPVSQVVQTAPLLANVLSTIDDYLGSTTLKQTQEASSLWNALKDISAALYYECEWGATVGANIR
jgi:hypothetical protein